MDIIEIDNELQSYNYTKISCIIQLEKNISDYSKEYNSYFEAYIDKFKQEKCYIDSLMIEELSMTRATNLNTNKLNNVQLAQWNLEIIINGSIEWIKCYKLIYDYCTCLSFFASLKLDIDHAGIAVFTFDYLNLNVLYGKNKREFIVKSRPQYGNVYRSKVSNVKGINITLPNTQFDISDIKFFIDAISRNDQISKYILLYYFIERICGSNEFIIAKNDLEKELNCKLKIGKDKAKILLHYLKLKNIYKYKYNFQTKEISENDIEKIITTRNDIVHRASTQQIYDALYGKLLPIVKSIVQESFENVLKSNNIS